MAGKKVDYKLLRTFLTRLDESLDRPGVLFLLGGSSLTWRGIKDYSADIDLALAEGETDPVPLLDAIDRATDFIEAIVDVIRMGETLPLPEGYAERAELAETFAHLRLYHFDPYSIALTKLARSEGRDIADVSSMLNAGLIDCTSLRHHFESVSTRIPRGVSRSDREDFKRKVETFYQQHCG